jgi:quinol monooxygenase YgiN
MITLFVRHQVRDFAAWRQVYDDLDATRQSMGVTGQAVYRGDGDPNDVTVSHDFATAEAAKQFVESEVLRNAMRRAGVASEPTIWLTERV